MKAGTSRRFAATFTSLPAISTSRRRCSARSQRPETHGFDLETLATFDEALTAHRHGLYRATPRTLFPDIERKARDVLDENGMATQSGLRGLRRAVDALGLENFTRSGVVSSKLYRMFARHLYSTVRTSERLAEVAADPVPRHRMSSPWS